MSKFGKFTLSYVSVDEGFICIRKSGKVGFGKTLFDIYTFCPNFGNFEYQFSFGADTLEEASDIALGNYYNGNLFWQFELECSEICESCDRRYKCHNSEYSKFYKSRQNTHIYEDDGESF